MVNKIGTVILIDDEVITQKQYTRVMKRSKSVEKIISFTYADEALEYLKENPDLTFDVILLDINMPRMDGFEFLDAVERELKRKVSRVLIVMLTTSLNPKDRERAEKNELVTDFMNKPLDIESLNHVMELLEEKS